MSAVGLLPGSARLSIVASLTSAIALFVIFRLGVSFTSIAWIGAWSLIQGLLFVSRVADAGTGSNLTRVMAVRTKAGISRSPGALTRAALLISTGPVAVVAIVLTPPIAWYVSAQFADQLNAEGVWQLTALAMLSAILSSTATILLSICEGAFQLNFRSRVVIASNVLALAIAYPSIVFLGPVGIGWIYVVMYLCQIIPASVRVMRLSNSEAHPGGSLRESVQALWRENAGLSLSALMRLGFEPVTKLLLSAIGALGLIAYFELAMRVTIQVRVLAQAGLQPLLAAGARQRNGDDHHFRDLFARGDRTVLIVAMLSAVAQIAGTPAIALLGLGHYDTHFLWIMTALVVGSSVNMQGLAGYYYQLASGNLKPILTMQLAMVAVSLTVGVIGFVLDQAWLVVAAYALAFFVGGVLSRALLAHVTLMRSAGSAMIPALPAIGAALFVGTFPNPSTLELVVLTTVAGVFTLAGLSWAHYSSSRRGYGR